MSSIEVGQIDDIRDCYRAEPVRAQTRADRVARPQVPPFALIPAAAHQPPAATAAPTARAVRARQNGPGDSVNPLRDQYAAHCLKNAIQAFHDQQARLDALAAAADRAQQDELAALQARAEAANDLGTIQGLLPLQTYRFAVGIALILPQHAAPAAGAAHAVVSPVAPAATPRGATDDAFGSDPAARARARNPRDAAA
ncbi:hypothetical protein [Achromobacter agilis]|uniref:Uncharacterized protein n=1 Tax=Achromobacter agilis TaxID=1353888 RepID=A0A446CQF6_9BURK|nr:hypothetical protein [Achromobacter agilis]SSW70025.1 hypothetical protein AGI3411_04475 [Achromobacter agilis]